MGGCGLGCCCLWDCSLASWAGVAGFCLIFGSVWFIFGLGGVYVALGYSIPRGTWEFLRCGPVMQVLLQFAIETGNFVDWDILHRFQGELIFLDFGLDFCRRRHLIRCQPDWLVLKFHAARGHL